MKSRSLSEVSIDKISDKGSRFDETDLLAVEEPLEIRLGFYENGRRKHQAVSVTMRTPDHDFELAAGFLFTEAIIKSADQIETIKHCAPKTSSGWENTVRVDLRDGADVDISKLQRHFYTSSSCGVCGKSSIEAIQTGVSALESDLVVKAEMIHQLPEILRQSQIVFGVTGGLHASALFDADGNLEILREDVGRHNALDKVIGAEFLAGKTPLSDKILLVSGRVSFELVQKALMAGIPILAAVGSPSSLAVELAEEYGMTLIGFVRGNRFNIYSGRLRVV